MIDFNTIQQLEANTCFVAISHRAGEGFRGCDQIDSAIEYKDLRRIVIASIRDTKHIEVDTLRRFDPPRPQRNGCDGLIVAEFAMQIHICNATVDQWFRLLCRLVTGSPASNKSHTLILMEAQPWSA
jgi:hypothetical protein